MHIALNANLCLLDGRGLRDIVDALLHEMIVSFHLRRQDRLVLTNLIVSRGGHVSNRKAS